MMLLDGSKSPRRRREPFPLYLTFYNPNNSNAAGLVANSWMGFLHAMGLCWDFQDTQDVVVYLDVCLTRQDKPFLLPVVANLCDLPANVFISNGAHLIRFWCKKVTPGVFWSPEITRLRHMLWVAAWWCAGSTI